MLIKTPKKYNLNDSSVTDESVYLERRNLLKKMGFLGVGALMNSAIVRNAHAGFFSDDDQTVFQRKTLDYSNDTLNQSLLKTPEGKVISHNNFYEFGAKKINP